MNKIFFNALLWLGLLSIFSCKTNRNVVYFKDLSDTSILREIASAPYIDPIIQSDDILNITIQSADPSATNSVNQGNTASSVGTSTAGTIGNQMITGFLVDREGFIEFPLIGKVKVAGLTTTQARDSIRKLAENEYKKPAVQVRFVNYKITVLGEVNRPATYTVPNEKVSVLDALGLAGDLTIYGKRENVMLIRDNGNAKQIVRLNLNSSETLKSPYFYLRQKDVIYVEPNDAKVAANNAARTQTIAIAGTVLSLLIVLISRL